MPFHAKCPGSVAWNSGKGRDAAGTIMEPCQQLWQTGSDSGSKQPFLSPPLRVGKEKLDKK